MEALEQKLEETGPRHVFICHSSQDSEFASGLCTYLESRGIPCWIAPRDVTPSQNWAKAILDAISGSGAIVLISSSGANDSPHVIREIERGVHRRVPVLPIRLERIPPSDELEYFVSSCQWIDACDKDREEVFAHAAETLVRIMKGDDPQDAPSFIRRWTSDPIPRDRFIVRRKRVLSKAAGFWSYAVMALIVCTAFIAGGFYWGGWDLPLNLAAPRIELRVLSPDEGAAFVGGGLKYEWDTRGGEERNVVFEVERLNEVGKSERTVVPQKSFVEHSFQGPIRWRVRAKWTDAFGKTRTGPWTAYQKVTYFRNSLEKIRATGRLTVAVSDEDAQYEDGKVTGFEVELLREILSRYLKQERIGHKLKLDFHIEPWSETFLSLAHSPEVDLLAAGITVTKERVRRYGLVFSNPVNEYPHSLLTRPGVAPFIDGKLAIRSLAVSEGTSNQAFGEKILAEGVPVSIESYSGSNVYSDMIWDLISGKVEGVLLDQPYARKWKQHFASQGYSLIQSDLTADKIEGATNERIAVATRQGNESIIKIVNEGLTHLSSTRKALLKKFHLS